MKASTISDSSSASDQSTFEDNGLTSNTTVPDFEALQLYRCNYFHPVHLGDVLDNHYKVLHKLGQGSSATVWLCRDLNINSNVKYVAIKILTAMQSEGRCPDLEVERLELEEERQYLCLSLDQFRLDGPNGQHLAIVYPVHGPCANNLPHLFKTKNIGRKLRLICRAVVRAISTLHENEICHGDLRPDNILVQLKSLDQYTERSVMRIFGQPETEQVLTVSGERHDQSSAPQYLVGPVVWNDMESELHNVPILTDRVSVCDFGSCFSSTEMTQRDTGICPWYGSPEYMLGSKPGISTDLWALACTIFEIRTGRPLFATKGEHYDRDEQLCEIVWVLGPFPEPWWSSHWKDRRQFFRDRADRNGDAVPMIQPMQPDPDSRARSLEDCIVPGLRYKIKERVQDYHHGIEQPERELLADLLRQLLKYQPEDRLTARKVLQHPWFEM